MREWLTLTRGSTRPVVVAVLLAMLLGLAELPFASFMADDLIQLGALEQVSPCSWIGPLNLYTISDGARDHVRAMKDVGAFPWFFDDGFAMVFFRPLSSALLALDHALFGLHPIGYRVHGQLWFLLLVLALGALLQQVLPKRLGSLALLVFTISGIHGTMSWTATRHIVIAAALGVLGLACHVGWRAAGWRPGRLLSVVALALALTASEAAVGVIGYLLAYELLGAAGPRRDRLKACLPVAAIALVYLASYRLLGFGASGGSGYINPLAEPLAFAVELPGRLVFLAGSVVMGGNADLWVLRPGLRPMLMVAGTAAVLMLTLLVRAVWPATAAREQRAVRWLLAGALASALPFLGTPIGSRCLLLPMVGGAAAIALVLERWWVVLRRSPDVRNRLVGVACTVLALIHLVIAPIQRVSSPFLLRTMMFERLATAMTQAELDEEKLAAQTVVIVAAPDIVIGFHSFFYRTLYRMPMPSAWRVLSWGAQTHRFTRTAVDTLEMELVGGALAGAHLNKGAVFEVNGMRARVLDASRAGATRVELRFDRSLDDPSLYLMAWQHGRLRHVPPPQLGQVLIVPTEVYNPFA
jgi:hypothetical protein